MGKALMMERHVREMDAGRASDDRSAWSDAHPAYAKPALVALGRWNVFTRAPSENPDEGFFEFDFGG